MTSMQTEIVTLSPSETQVQDICFGLRKRYACNTPGHRLCAINARGVHKPLEESDIDCLVEALNDPHRFLAVMNAKQESPVISNSASYQSLQRQTSMTGYRTFQHNLSERSLSSISTEFSNAFGPGSLLGKFCEWSGKPIVAWFVRMEVIKRCWSIGRLCRKIESLDGFNRTQTATKRSLYFSRNSIKVFHALEDLMELGKSKYGEKICGNTANYIAMIRLYAHRNSLVELVALALPLATEFYTNVPIDNHVQQNARWRDDMLSVMLTHRLQPENALEIVLSCIGYALLRLIRRPSNLDPNSEFAQFLGYFHRLPTWDGGIAALVIIEERHGLLTALTTYLAESPPQDTKMHLMAIVALFHAADQIENLRALLSEFIPVIIGQLLVSSGLEVVRDMDLLEFGWSSLSDISRHTWATKLILESEVVEIMKDSIASSPIVEDLVLVETIAGISESQLNLILNICKYGDEGKSAIRLLAGPSMETFLATVLAGVMPDAYYRNNARPLIVAILQMLGLSLSTMPKLKELVESLDSGRDYSYCLSDGDLHNSDDIALLPGKRRLAMLKQIHKAVRQVL